jgi:hypothetical protein
MAEFCFVTKMSPSEYRALTLYEYHAFVKALQPSQSNDSWQL